MWKWILEKVKPKKPMQKRKNDTGLIAWDMSITGDIKFEGTLHIEGKVKGNISSEQGVLTLSDSSYIEGDICVASIRINGTIKGNVFCLKHLFVSQKAIISGNVHYAAIEMIKGAEVNGNLENIDSSLIQSPDSLKALIPVPNNSTT